MINFQRHLLKDSFCSMNCESYFLPSNTIFHYALSFVFIVLPYFDMLPILTHIHFSLCVCVALAVLASIVPRLQSSPDATSPLADEHALIASYVARLQHNARSVVGQPAPVGTPSPLKVEQRRGRGKLMEVPAGRS